MRLCLLFALFTAVTADIYQDCKDATANATPGICYVYNAKEHESEECNNPGDILEDRVANDLHQLIKALIPEQMVCLWVSTVDSSTWVSNLPTENLPPGSSARVWWMDGVETSDTRLVYKNSKCVKIDAIKAGYNMYKCMTNDTMRVFERAATGQKGTEDWISQDEYGLSDVASCGLKCSDARACHSFAYSSIFSGHCLLYFENTFETGLQPDPAYDVFDRYF